MTNLLKETLAALDTYGYTVDDIEAVFGGAFAIPIDEFVELAKATDYNAGYGAPEVATDLTVLMKDGSWYSRGEYDGSEWWQYNRRPSPPADVRHVTRLTAKCIGWEPLAQCNREEDCDEGN